uniref:TIL domain-containing protein n=1 Tax=Onchocerca volvulus TaxID=6282 RepID=A0A8R1TZ78_ONCVO
MQKCVDSCFCKEGFVLEFDKFIPESNFPVVRECNKNEVCRKRGSSCPEICGKNCNDFREGCFCKLGYILEEKTGTCVKPEDFTIPKYIKCPGNETFRYYSIVKEHVKNNLLIVQQNVT